jgi:Flp pilus assembly protein TadG
MTLRRLITQAWRQGRGTAAIEFAIIAPVLVAVAIATAELGFAIRASLEAQQAAAAGALYAGINGWNAAGITGAVLAATGETKLTASPAPRLYCGCPLTTGVSTATCGVTCADGRTARQYVEVSATLPRVSVVSSQLGLAANMTRRSTVRLP